MITLLPMMYLSLPLSRGEVDRHPLTSTGDSPRSLLGIGRERGRLLVGLRLSAVRRLRLRQLRAPGAGQKFLVSLSVELLDDGDVHHAETALHLALLALQLGASLLGGRSCGEEEEDDDGCPRSCRRRPGRGSDGGSQEEGCEGGDGDGASAAASGEEEDGARTRRSHE